MNDFRCTNGFASWLLSPVNRWKTGCVLIFWASAIVGKMVIVLSNKNKIRRRWREKKQNVWCIQPDSTIHSRWVFGRHGFAVLIDISEANDIFRTVFSSQLLERLMRLGVRPFPSLILIKCHNFLLFIAFALCVIKCLLGFCCVFVSTIPMMQRPLLH